MLNPNPKIRVHTRERSSHRNLAAAHSVLAVYFFKGTTPQPLPAGDGVSTYLALTFGTLLSSQGTDASFVLTPTGFPPGASLRSCIPDSIRPFLRLIPSQRGLSSRLLGRSDE